MTAQLSLRTAHNMLSQPLWTQLKLVAPPEDHDTIIVDVVTRFSDHLKSTYAFAKIFFLRSPPTSPQHVSVYFLAPEQIANEAHKKINLNLPPRIVVIRDSKIDAFPDELTFVTGAASRHFARTFLSLTSDFIVKLIGMADRINLATDLMLLHPLFMQPHLFHAARDQVAPNTFISFRSHADGFFLMSKSPTDTRSTFERHFQSASTGLLNRLRRLSLNPSNSPAFEWKSFIDTTVPSLVPSFQAGSIGFTAPPEDERMSQNYNLDASPFHALIETSSRYQEFMRTDAEFLALRFMSSMLYCSLSQIGVRLIERYLLCHVVSRTYEEMFSVTAEDLLKQAIQRISEAPTA